MAQEAERRCYRGLSKTPDRIPKDRPEAVFFALKDQRCRFRGGHTLLAVDARFGDRINHYVRTMSVAVVRRCIAHDWVREVQSV